MISLTSPPMPPESRRTKTHSRSCEMDRCRWNSVQSASRRSLASTPPPPSCMRCSCKKAPIGEVASPPSPSPPPPCLTAARVTMHWLTRRRNVGSAKSVAKTTSLVAAAARSLRSLCGSAASSSARASCEAALFCSAAILAACWVAVSFTSSMRASCALFCNASTALTASFASSSSAPPVACALGTDSYPSWSAGGATYTFAATPSRRSALRSAAVSPFVASMAPLTSAPALCALGSHPGGTGTTPASMG